MWKLGILSNKEGKTQGTNMLLVSACITLAYLFIIRSHKTKPNVDGVGRKLQGRQLRVVLGGPLI